MSDVIQDVCALTVPPAVNLDDPDIQAVLPRFLTKVAIDKTWAQYVGVEKPADLEFSQIDWLVTSDPDDVAKFQPAHDCPACLAGQDQMLAFLKANPGRSIAMANIAYREIWA